jgi:periplasmic copper chaperone A
MLRPSLRAGLLEAAQTKHEKGLTPMFKNSQLLQLGLILAAAIMLSLPASAAEFKAGSLTVDNPWMRATPAGAKAAGAYAKITNHGTDADTLVGGSAEGAAKVQVHEMTVKNNVMKMHEVKGGLEIKPGETVVLKPGSYHLMLMDLKGPYTKGKTVKGTLAFKNAGKVDVEFVVEAIGAKAAKGEGDTMEGMQGHDGMSNMEGHK